MDMVEDQGGGGEDMSFRQMINTVKLLFEKLANLRRTSLLTIYEEIEASHVREITSWRLGIDGRTLMTLLAVEVSLEKDRELQAMIEEERTRRLLKRVELSFALEKVGPTLEQEPERDFEPDAERKLDTDRKLDADRMPDSAKSEAETSRSQSMVEVTRSQSMMKSMKAPEQVNGIPLHIAAAMLSHLGVNMRESLELSRQKFRSPTSCCSDKVDEWLAGKFDGGNIPCAMRAVARLLQFSLKIVIIAWAAHPLRDIISVSLHSRHAGRTFLLIAAQMMGATCSCLFFSATQGVGADSPPQCVPQQGIAALVQTIVVQLVSVLVGTLFATWFLMFDENHRSVRTSTAALFKAVVFYVSAAMLFVFFGYTVSSFIANTAEGSTFQWVIALVVGQLQLFFVGPLTSAATASLLWPLSSTLLMVIWTLKGLPVTYEHPKMEGQEEKEPELSILSQRPQADDVGHQLREDALDLPVELLDFYASLEVMAKSNPNSPMMGPGPTPAAAWVLEEPLNAAEDENLPEHVVDFLEVIEVIANTSRSRSLTRSRSRGREGRSSRSSSSKGSPDSRAQSGAERERHSSHGSSVTGTRFEV